MKNNGISFLSLLGLLFIGLKLSHNIDWSWWWVTAPFWIGAALVVAVIVGVGVFAGLLVVISGFIDARRARARRASR